MPSKTRFELFKQSADRFVQQFHRRFFPGIRTINYDVRERNKYCSNSSATQVYKIAINKKYLVYENTVTGEKVYEEIGGLTSELVKEDMEKFYEPYQIRDVRGEIISYCKLTQIMDSEEKIICKLVVHFHNRYEKPFPSEERDLEQVRQLSRELKQQKKMAKAVSTGHARMVHTIRDLFSKLPTKPDCPVCYVEMAVEKLAINPCCHLLCGDCNNRLVRDKKGCPECRGPIALLTPPTV
uniref:RING-type domain-containing protein n=1 Tax=viral metagenome TaxID=1070528 RepID=A0A6C0I4N9_9ZZZZ